MEKQMTRRKTQEQARAMFASRGATMVGEYVGTKTPVECVCDTCGATGWPTYGHVQGGRGACATCGYARRTKEQTKPEAEARAIASAAGFTPDADAPYPGRHTPWPGTCDTCNKTISPNLANIQQGRGACKYCAGKARHTEEEARAMAIAGGFTPDADAPYPGRGKPWPGTCDTCGEAVSPHLGSIQQGCGACSGCADYGYDPTKPAHLYLMAGDHDGLPWLKVGITNNAPANRAKEVGGTIIDSVLYENGADAHRDEQEILGQLGDIRGTGIPEGGNGYTESWSAWLMPVTTLTELRERYAVAA
jgi:formylmethanofuran dehydrogenase subunit E